MSVNAVIQRIRAPRVAIYPVLLDPRSIQEWRVPEGMRCVVHEFAGREGGPFRISLSYDDPTLPGKSRAHTDIYHGRFARLIPDEKIVEVLEFETPDPSLQGEITVTTTLTDADDGTDVTVTYHNLPAGIATPDNELGTRMALRKLADLVERSVNPR